MHFAFSLRYERNSIFNVFIQISQCSKGRHYPQRSYPAEYMHSSNAKKMHELSLLTFSVIPPKPLGPLEARSIQSTWLLLCWRARLPVEEELIDKYVIEYRNARETRWARVGQTMSHEYEVNGYVIEDSGCVL